MNRWSKNAAWTLVVAAQLALAGIAQAQPAQEPPVPPAPAAPPPVPTPAAPAPGPAQPDTSQPPPSEVPPPPPLAPEAAPVIVPAPFATPPLTDDKAHGTASNTLLLAPNIGVAALGGALLIAAAIQGGVASGQVEQYCGVSGCVDRPSPHAKNITANFIGIGAGLAVDGLTGILAAALAPPRGDEDYKNKPMMLIGFSAVAGAAAMFGAGIAQAVTYDDRSADYSTAWPLFVGSGVLFGAGIPLYAIGAAKSTAKERHEAAALANGPSHIHSRRMVITGAVLVGIAGLGTIAATGLFIADTAGGGPGFTSVLIALPTASAAGIFASIGIPFLCVGAHKEVGPPPPKVKAEAALPEVAVTGPGLSATWRLP